MLAVEEQATAEQIREEQLRTELIRLRELHKAVSHVMDIMDTSRDESNRDTDGQNAEWYDYLEHLLSEVYDSIEGRMQEVYPSYYEDEHYWLSRNCPLMQKARYARENGINFMALQGLSTEEFYRAIKYITEHGLASMNYEATRKAFTEFFNYELDERINARIKARIGC